MILTAAPIKQRNHTYINNAIDKWLDIHFGDTSFNGLANIGRRKNNIGPYSIGMRPLTKLRPFVKQVLASLQPDCDYYITANTVTGKTRRAEHLFGLQNIVIDVDCHDRSIQPHAILEFVQRFIWRSKRDLWDTGVIPTPNSIVRTGRGVQLWWAIVPCYGGRDYGISLYHHKKIKNNFMDHIGVLLDTYSEEFGGLKIDRGPSSNVVGYFRLPFSFNTKTNTQVSLEILHSKRYDQRDLTRLERVEVDSGSEVRSSEVRSVSLQETDRIILKNFKGLGVRRVLQFIKLRNLRNSNVGEEKRDLFNFSVYNALRMTLDHEESMVYLQSFNAGFKEPMTNSELEHCVSAAKKIGGYKYSNVELISLLEITDYEQRLIGMFSSPKKHLAKPNASRDAARKALKDDRDSKIVSLFEKGTSQVEIARILGIGKNTVYRVLKRLREQAEEMIETNNDDDNSRHHFGSLFAFLLPRPMRGTTYNRINNTDKAPQNRGVSFVIPSRDSS